MHNCTSVWGKILSIASGKPFSPSTQAIKMSLTPRFFSSVTTCNQNLAPSVCAIHKPQHFLHARDRQVDRLVSDVPAIAHLKLDGIQIHDRVDRVELPVRPHVLECLSTTTAA